jgi:hypothetical protein
MSWARIDDSFPEHPKIQRISDKAYRLHVNALCYCNRNLTDGVLSTAAVRAQKTAIRATKRHVEELVDGALWGPLTGGYEIHDFLEWNPSAAVVKRKRAEARERMEAHRSRERSLEHSGERSQNVPDGIGTKRKKHSQACPDCGLGGGLHIADCGQVTAALKEAG